jgi:two-component system, response regulator RegA
MNKNLIIIDDDARLRASLKLEFEDHGWKIIESEGQILQNQCCHYALVDLRLKNINGLDLIDQLKLQFPEIKIVIMTGYASISTAVEAIKRGATNYIQKPFTFQMIEAALLNQPVPEAPHTASSLEEKESDYIHSMLLRFNGNISQTAKALGLHRQSLQRKLRKNRHVK